MATITFRSSEDRSKALLQVAQDMRDLVDRFADHPDLADRPSYQVMVKMFHERCEIVENKIQIKAHPGGNAIQNPSDPDATYDGHKGHGYQVQGRKRGAG